MPKYINVAKQLVRLYRLNLDCADVIKEFLVSAEPEEVVKVKHGKWIRKSPTAWMWTCSCCKKEDAYAYSAGESFEPDVLQDLFCPNCGAKMDGKEPEDVGKSDTDDNQ